MWTFTGYIIYKLCKARNTDRLKFSALYDFMFKVLWRKYKIALVESGEELKREVEFLAEINALEFDGREIKIKEKLKNVANTVEHSKLREELLLYREYLSRINEAIKEVERSS